MTRDNAHRTPASGYLAGRVHHFPLRVYYEDTDAAGVVYYANYLKFAERARTEMMRLIKVEHSVLLAETGIAFVVRALSADYRLPARLDDVIELRSEIVALGGASITIVQEVWRDEAQLAALSLKLGLIDRNGRPARLPAALKRAIGLFAPNGAPAAAPLQPMKLRG